MIVKKRSTGDGNAGDDQPGTQDVPRSGVKMDRVALWTFLIIEIAYLVLAGYAIQQLFTDWDGETDFTGTVDNFGSRSTITSTSTSTSSGGLDLGDLKTEPISGSVLKPYEAANG